MAKKKSKAPAVAFPKRGEIYLVNFDPTLGAEIRKTRPALVLQNDIANHHSPITIVAAITSQVGDKVYPTEVMIWPPEGGLKKTSMILLNQIRSIDKRRLVMKLGQLKNETLRLVGKALEISLSLRDI